MNDENTIYWNPVYERYDKNINKDLLQLFNAAIYALKEEDASLSKAFAQIPHKLENFYCESNRGLAYSVFETALVYIIFKAWIPLVPVSWEEGYPGSSQKKADLVVFDEKTEEVKYLFEAKWWMSNRKYALSSLRKDVLKMMDWEGSHDRFLITFWYSDLSFWKDDRIDILNFTNKPVSIRRHKQIGLIEIYYGAFPTDVRKADWVETKEGYFGISVLKVKTIK